MVNLRQKDYGRDANKAVNLVAIFYHSAVQRDQDSGQVTAVYLDNRLHPEDRRAAGQGTLALTWNAANSAKGFTTKSQFSLNQAKAIKEAAGDNKTPVLNKKGEQVGIAFGYQADLVASRSGGGYFPKSETIRPSGASVRPVGNKTIMNQIYDKQAKNKASKQKKQAQQSWPAGPAWDQKPPSQGQEPQMG